MEIKAAEPRYPNNPAFSQQVVAQGGTFYGATGMGVPCKALVVIIMSTVDC